MPRIDSAQLTWNAGVNTLDLVMPLQRKIPGRRTLSYTKIALDGSAVETRKIGNGQYCAVVEIRYQDQAGFMAFLVAAIEDKLPIDYIPDTNAPANKDTFYVIEPESVEDALSQTELAPAVSDVFHATQLKIMKTDETDFAYLYSV